MAIPSSYYNIPAITCAINEFTRFASLHINPWEDRTKRLTNALLNNYFPLANNWLIGPEQQRDGGIADFIVNKLDLKYGQFVQYDSIFVECKRNPKDYAASMTQLSLVAQTGLSNAPALCILVHWTKILFFNYFGKQRPEPGFHGLLPIKGIPATDDQLSGMGVQILKYYDGSILVYIWDLTRVDHEIPIDKMFRDTAAEGSLMAANHDGS